MGEADRQALEKLLMAVAHDLRLPLIQIKSSLDAAGQEEINDLLSNDLQSASQSGLRLIEAYLLSTAHYRNYELNLEPTSVSQLLEDAAHEVSSTASSYQTNLEVYFPKNIQPIITNKRMALLAVSCLCDSLIKSQSIQGNDDGKVVISARSFNKRICIGSYIRSNDLNLSELNKLRRLVGVSQQPSSIIANHSASGILLADRLCSLVAQPLKISSRFGLRGLTTSFLPSNQIPMAL